MFIDFWCEIYEFVKRKPSRTILTGIGISWGIFILIVLVGIGSGFERGVFKLFNGFSKSTTYVYASETSMGYKGAASGRKIQFQKEDLDMLKSRIPEITHLSPETGRWNAVYADMKNGWFETRGVYPDYFRIKLLEIEHGRALNALDMNEARKVVLIGENDAARMAYLNAVYSVPSRLYPKYLLVQLLMESSNKAEAYRWVKDILVTKEKVSTTAAQDIKDEITHLLENELPMETD